MPNPIPLDVSFWQKTIRDPDTDCWEWTAAKSTAGYGRLWSGGGRECGFLYQAHRVAYAMLVGEIPEGAELDHLCRNRGCVNPAHLEPVTTQENAARGKNGRLKTHCTNGHPWIASNIMPNGRGHRCCRICKNAHERERWRMRFKA